MMEKLIRNFNNEAEFNYSIHISEEFRFIYFNNPKCACTTVKATLNQSCAKALGKSLHYSGMQDIHNRQMNVLLNPAQIGYQSFKDKLFDRRYFKFCFIREPVRRVASAFQDKLTWDSQFRVALNRSLVRPGTPKFLLSSSPMGSRQTPKSVIWTSIGGFNANRFVSILLNSTKWGCSKIWRPTW